MAGADGRQRARGYCRGLTTVGPHPAVAAIRHAVRSALAGLRAGDLVLGACSGGADSLALAAALAFEAPRAGLLAGGITVDHGLQAGSAGQAGAVAKLLADLGLSPVLSVGVTVPARGDGLAGYAGPEAAARAARYSALEAAAAQTGAVAIMLGHTLDDQAETVLLGLARGSGARSLAGMAPVSDGYLRPLLGIRRAQTRAACTALCLPAWEDPQNQDPAYARVRVRKHALPALEADLGPGMAEALARTASMLRADADALDLAAAAQIERLGGTGAAIAPAGAGWAAEDLRELPPALRTRVLRSLALAAGCPAGQLSFLHVARMEELVTSWHGQRAADLPGGIRCQRRYGRLLLTGPARSEDLGGRE
jgi:tRNA(Ile)-lysidine synthase